ncbi:autophagy protein Apg9-domain-containing protein [Syncephalis plumigaleata]|nr:autophagy protein Apg9-domain-containing protein [Syncephalis plumigaleata]
MSGWLKFFVVAAWLYWSWKLVVFVYDVRKLVEMYNFYTFLLEIPDCDMQTVDWNLVVSRIIKLRETTPSILNAHPSLRINAHDICNRILRKENYLIALINKDLLDLTVPAPLRYMPMLGGPLLTRTVEWNLQLCLINYAFDENGQVKKAFLRDSQRHMLIEGLRRRFITMGFINFICAPFIFVYLLLMLFFRYLAEYHKYPSAISSRQYTRFARWKFREFDELPHLFQKRLDRSLEDANRYVDQFPRQNTAHLARFISFIAGSFALVLFLLTILDQELLISFYITSDRSVAFYLGLFGTIFAVARGAIPDENIVFEPEKTLRAVVAETHYLPSEWRNRLHTDEIRRQFCELFDLKVTILLQELIAVIFTPFILWFSLPGCSSQIIDFFREFTVHVDGVGYICSFALFDFKRHGNIRYGAPSEAINEHYISKEGKMEKSFINFKANNPDWEPEDMAGSLYLTRLQGNGGGGGGMTNEQSRVRRSTSGTTARGEDMSSNTRMMNQSPRNRTHPLMHQRTFSAESLNDSMLEETTLSPMNNEVTGLSSDNNNNNNSNSISLYGPTTNTLGSLPPLPYTSSHQQEDDTMSQQGQQQQPQHSISHSGAAYRSTIATSDDIEHHPLHMTAAFNIRPTLEENDVQQRNIDATLADLSAMKATMMRDSQWPPSEDEQYHKDNGNDNDDSDDITENGGIASTSTSTAMTVQNTMENIEQNISSTIAITTITQTTAYHTTATLNGNDNNNDEDANDNEADDDDVKSNEDGNVFALMNEFYDDRLPTL